MMTTTVSAQAYSDGQVWEYRTRPNEPRSLLRIAKVETDPKLGEIFHISIVGLKVSNPNAPTRSSSELPHSPVSRKTLDASVTKLSDSQVTFPDFHEGYTTWKEAFDKGKAGVFTIPVTEIITIVEDALSGKRR